eukprot:TRINITY_DN40949_c0_g1_i1.p1 TRINITY_DN40949_c0_g1~~TRINITY_DN40949_c0_g1_i1.p1  ORF type:complete len:356 (-),score=66.18 TRINITY_DN40949_c0_g1_i1:2-1069(-)
MPIAEPASLEESPWLAAVAFLPGLGVLWAVATGAKFVAAHVQQGAVQTRGLHGNETPLLPVEKKVQKKRLARDQFLFTCGVMNVGFTMWLQGYSPVMGYTWWHSIKVVLLTSWRWYSYRQKKQHYFLWDLCYWVNFLSLAYLWVMPDAGWVFEDFFILANGPLAWSVLAFNNSLVFHSEDHMISCFIHISPVLLSYGLRWHALPDGRFIIHRHADATTSILSQVAAAELHFYIPWMVVYYVWVLVVMDSRVRSREYLTLYSYVTSKGMLAPLMPYVSRHSIMQKTFYCLSHYLFGLITAILAALLWRNYWAHTFFIFSMCFCACWNGGGYYFRYFARRYMEKLEAETSKAQSSQS